MTRTKARTKAEAIRDAINGALRAPVLTLASDKEFVVTYMPTGLLPFDILMGGGLPRGRFTVCIGDWCVAPESLVLSAEYDWVPAGSLRPGQEIVAFDEETQGRGVGRCLRTATVQRSVRKTLPCYEITTDKGTKTVSSIGHKWLSMWESQRSPIWRQTQELGVGDRIAWFGAPWGQAKDQEAAQYLAGLFDGEGWVENRSARVTFAQNPGVVLDRGLKLLGDMGFETTVRTANGQKSVQAVYIRGGLRELMRFGSQVPTVRLKPKIEKAWVGRGITRKGRNAWSEMDWAVITKIRYVGERQVVALGTSTNTLIVDGMYSHNSVLKSYVGLCAIAAEQARGGVCALIDTEHSFDPVWAGQCGVDVGQLIIPPREHLETGEQAVDYSEMLIRNGVDLIVFDSVAATLPQAERDRRLHKESQQMARLAALMSRAMRKLTAPNSRTAVFWVNQLRVNVGIQFGNPETPTGGRALPYFSSLTIEIRKVGKVTRNIRVHDGDAEAPGKEVIAQKFRAQVVKSKVSKPLRDVWFDWSYLQGGRIDTEKFLFAQGIEHGLVRKAGNRWSIKGSKTTVYGREKFINHLRSNPAARRKLERMVRQVHNLPGGSGTVRSKAGSRKRSLRGSTERSSIRTRGQAVSKGTPVTRRRSGSTS